MSQRHFSIQEKIEAYHGNTSGDHNRYRSWEHCYNYFHNKPLKAIKADRDHAALQLAFYLASWGMYRGAGFLLQYAYTIHLGVIDRLVDPHFATLWQEEFGSGSNDVARIPLILGLVSAIREAYQPFAQEAKSSQATETPITKVILGTVGSLPAFDRYFIVGFKSAGFRYPQLNTNVIEQLLNFCQNNLCELRTEQARINSISQMHYPLMKLVDMYFWQIGYERNFQ